MNKKTLLILVIVLAIVAGGIYYFTSVYKSPAQVLAEKQATREALQKKEADLAAIEEYLGMRENGTDPEGKTSTLQDAIIAAGEGLITASKDNTEDFDREVKALRTVISVDIAKLKKELGD